MSGLQRVVIKGESYAEDKECSGGLEEGKRD